jgi:hypothetical protein
MDAELFSNPDVLLGLEMKEPWASLVLKGEKTLETRTYALPKQLLGRPIVLLATASDSGLAGASGLSDDCPAGAATAVGLVTFGGVVRWESRVTWEGDFARHRVPPAGGGAEAFGWLRDETTGEAALCGWVVTEVIPMTPRPSPPMRRVLRSVFALDADVGQLLSHDDGSDGDDDDGEEDEEAGRWDDEGANDRPWH